MLTSKEKEGIQSILEKLSTRDLLAVAGTSTKGLIVPETRHEATEAILLYTEDASSFLDRKKITKPVLLQYLNDENVKLPLTGSKIDLVRTCLNHWQSGDEQQFNSQNHTAQSYIKNSSSEQCHNYQEQTAINPLLNEMGIKFTSWFFPMLNNLDGFGEQHFWPDCMLKVNVKVSSNQFIKALSGSDEVVHCLSGLIIKDKLHFDPNLTLRNGVVCSEESHGLIKIIVQGVVHRPPQCVGLFDQGFGLVKDPVSYDCWKIKHSELFLHVTGDILSLQNRNTLEDRMLCDM